MNMRVFIILGVASVNRSICAGCALRFLFRSSGGYRHVVFLLDFFFFGGGFLKGLLGNILWFFGVS